MLVPRIIPCLDVRAGRVVKGVRFAQLRDLGDPAALARAYQKQGADEIVLLDISATLEERSAALNTIREVRRALSIPLTVGGGIRNNDDAEQLLRAGADRVSVNSAAVLQPDLLTQLATRFGQSCVVLAIDAKPVTPNTWQVWTASATLPSGLDVLDWARRAQRLGAGELLVTSWDRDGCRTGFDVELLAALRATTRLSLIASGGASSPRDFAAAFHAGADAALAASIFHESTWTVGAIKAQLRKEGWRTRS